MKSESDFSFFLSQLRRPPVGAERGLRPQQRLALDHRRGGRGGRPRLQVRREKLNSSYIDCIHQASDCFVVKCLLMFCFCAVTAAAAVVAFSSAISTGIGLHPTLYMPSLMCFPHFPSQIFLCSFFHNCVRILILFDFSLQAQACGVERR